MQPGGVESHARTMENTSTMSVCKGADGQWKADAAKPPKDPRGVRLTQA